MSARFFSLQSLSRRQVVVGAAAGATFAPNIWAQVASGVTASEVRVGQTAALTGPLSFANVQAKLAATALFDDVNRAGGVAGRRIRYVSADDSYDAVKAVANHKAMVADGGLLCGFMTGGAPANLALSPIFEEMRMPNVAPLSGLDQLRKPEHKQSYFTRASYGQELAKIADYLATSGRKTVAILFSDGAFGKGASAGFEAIAGKAGLTIAGKVQMPDGKFDLAALTQQLKATGAAGVVGLTSAVGALEWAKSELPKLGIAYLTISLLGNEASVQALGDSASGIVVSQTAPYPQNRKYPISVEMLALMNKQSGVDTRKLGFSAMEGYIAARLLVEGLKRAGRNLTGESFSAALGKAPFDLRGMRLDFTGGKRSGTSFVELSQVSRDGRFLQ